MKGNAVTESACFPIRDNETCIAMITTRVILRSLGKTRSAPSISTTYENAASSIFKTHATLDKCYDISAEQNLLLVLAPYCLRSSLLQARPFLMLRCQRANRAGNLAICSCAVAYDRGQRGSPRCALSCCLAAQSIAESLVQRRATICFRGNEEDHK